jgi:hypothetical protein
MFGQWMTELALGSLSHYYAIRRVRTSAVEERSKFQSFPRRTLLVLAACQKVFCKQVPLGCQQRQPDFLCHSYLGNGCTAQSRAKYSVQERNEKKVAFLLWEE